MVYLEHSGSKFWRCVAEGATVTTAYGKCGSDGRNVTKDFADGNAAEAYAVKQEASKRKGGYVDAADPSAPTRKRKAGTKKADGSKKAAGVKKVAGAVAPSPSKKVGLGGHAAPAADGERAVDTGVAGIDAALASRAEVDERLHARLALVDPAKNMDKYYVLQVLVDESPPSKKRGKKKKKGCGGPEYHLYTRWGRTGTGGQAKLDGPWDDEDSAREAFDKVFQSKTGVAFDEATAGEEPLRGKYEYLATKKGVSSDDAYWFYYLEDDPLGKPDGWYRYDQDNRDEVEGLFEEYLAADRPDRLSMRFITSGTSGFQYKVNLGALIQTNMQSGKERPIARTGDGNPPKGKPTAKGKSKPKAKPKAKAAPPATPPVKARPKVKATAAATKSPVKSPVKSAGTTSMAAVGAVDGAAPGHLQGGSVYEGHDVMLNQTNIGANNNKFYKIQLIQTNSGVTLFTRWGRVGEPGATQEAGPFDGDAAEVEFAKKFKSKTANKWEDRENFVPKKGKYVMVEMEADEEKAAQVAGAAAAAAGGGDVTVLPCKLDASTKALVDLIFDEDMFKSAMTNMDLDPRKMPLGALSQAQIRKGFSVLERLEAELEGRARPQELMDLTSEFYTVIPHAFGRGRGQVLNTPELVEGKYEMLNTLTDIEAAQAMQKKVKQQQTAATQMHASDLNYQQLSADLTLVSAKAKDYKLINAYFQNTKDRAGKLRHVWKANRHDEDKRFAAHSDLEERQLLWHGTNVAVVAAILKSGLRIMPHSGGRVGRGIYLADQHQKSAWYTCGARGTVIMFLVEAALGRSHQILKDDPSLTKAPSGYQSVLARGRTQPSKHVEMKIDGNVVSVPQGKPKAVPQARNSSFEHNEFLIYQESQHRIRYVLAFDE